MAEGEDVCRSCGATPTNVARGTVGDGADLPRADESPPKAPGGSGRKWAVVAALIVVGVGGVIAGAVWSGSDQSVAAGAGSAQPSASTVSAAVAASPTPVQSRSTHAVAPVATSPAATTTRYSQLPGAGVGELRPAGEGYQRYTNSRFGYAMDVPDSLVPQGEAGNSDGQRFLSTDGATEVAVWGGWNNDGDSVSSAFQKALADAQSAGRSVTYQASGDGVFTVSGYEPDGDIYYQRTWVTDSKEVTMTWVYPAARQPVIGPAIEHAAATFPP